MENKTIQIKTWLGRIIFEYESENNTIKETLLEAIKSGADLRRADLRGAKNKETAKLPIYCKWSIVILGDKIKIGCKEKTIEEWDLFFSSNEEFETNRDSEDFKRIQAAYLAYKAYVLHLKGSNQ